jgi:hypothetical protein
LLCTLCRVRHSAKPLPSVFMALPLGKAPDSRSDVCRHPARRAPMSCHHHSPRPLTLRTT